MAIPQSMPVRFTPRGLADAYDSTDVFPGACRKLANLVFDQSNPEIVVSRPGVGLGITSFDAFATPGFVSLHVTIGDRVYGMIATSLTTGHDEPFCFDLGMSSFIPITGVSSGNTEGRPVSPASTGAWIPPTLAVVGIKLIVTHPGYTGFGSSFFGVIDISNPAAPAYSTKNTATFGLPSAPSAVANLNNRAYFVCKNQVFYSDVLVPDVMTNAGQALTVGDSAPIVALGGLPIQTTGAGVVGALLVFKNSQIWQITGDAIDGTLALNYLSLSVGTAMPRSVVSTPYGTFFAGPDAAYVTSPNGLVLAVTSQIGSPTTMPDIRQPFGYVTEPTRAAAAFAGNIYRICIPTIVDGLAGTFDYWFDFRKMRWNGPHSFVYDCASSAGGYFILSGAGSNSKLFRGDSFRTTATSYFDNGSPYNISVRSADMPKKDEMSMKQVVESTVELSSAGGAMDYSATAYNETSTLLASATVVTKASGTLWGSNYWGDGTRWAAAVSQVLTYSINWPIPLVFNKLSIELTRPAGSNIAIGTSYFRMQKTGYTLQDLPALPAEPGPITPDPFAAYTRLMLHYEGANGGVIFTDTCGNYTVVNGYATRVVTSTDTKKFGVSSAYFDEAGTDPVPLRTTLRLDPELVILSGDFTVECFTYPHHFGDHPFWWTLDFEGAETAFTLTSDGGITVKFRGGLTGSTAAGVVSTGVWQHVAFVRSGNILTCYVNGIGKLTMTVPSTTYLHIGYLGWNSSGYFNSGAYYIDDFRVTAAARYLGAFVPPATTLQPI